MIAKIIFIRTYQKANGKKIAITRIHLEEDTGKLSHPAGANFSLVDFNRSGLPLIEMVTEPVIPDAQTAKAFCQRYQQVLRYLRVADADMEKGGMRCEANVSLQTKKGWKYKHGKIEAVGKNILNAKVELKNINSFKSLEKAIQFEIKRQTEVLEKGGTIDPETRGWNDVKNETVRQRVKESAADYRYFPEPDLPPVVLTPKWLKTIKARMVELPWKTEDRLRKEYGLSDYDSRVIAADKHLVGFTENVISELQAWVETSGDTWERQNIILSKLAANWIINELLKHLNEWNQEISELKLSAENFAELILLIHTSKVGSSAGQKILEAIMKAGGEPGEIMKRLGLEQIDDELALREVIQKVLAQQTIQVEQYKSGKTNVLQFFVGQVMASTKGAANPEKVKLLLEEELNK